MRDFEVLYSWVIGRIEYLTASPTAEAYSVIADPNRSNLFVGLIEKLDGFLAGLREARNDHIHFDKWSDFYQVITQFQQHFGDFPNAHFNQLRLFILLADKVSQATPALNSIDVDDSAFEIHALTTPLLPSWFSRENGQSIRESVAAFSCANLDALKVELDKVNLSPKFALHFLAALSISTTQIGTYHVLVRKLAPAISEAALEAFVKLSILATGKTIHAAKEYLALPAIFDVDKICIGPPYQQWNDILEVLSEYNSRRELLSKYLTIYHVIENFMFKRPIVELETKQAGKMFTIRDFRRLYSQVETTEIKALKQLFHVVSQLDATPGQRFSLKWDARWNGTVLTMNHAHVDKALTTLELNFGCAHFGNQDIHANMAHLVYSIRNAIVHNKETELHLTYAALDAIFTVIIESFLIPSLEEISFAMLGSQNSHLWYSQDKLFFYQ